MIRRRIGWLTLSLAVLLGISASAFAQDNNAPQGGNGGRRGRQGRGFGGGFGRGGRPQLSTLPLDYLKTSLKLTDEQVEKIKTIQEQVRTDMRAARPAPGSPPDADARKKMTDMLTASNKKVEEVLTDDQKKRSADVLKEAGIYGTAGIPLTSLPDLKLTDDQKKKFTELSESYQKAVQAIPQEERREKMGEIRTKLTEHVNEILTAEQKEIVDKARQSQRQGRNGGGRRNRQGAQGGQL